MAAPNPKRRMTGFSTGSSPIERLREILRSSRHAVVFTGAGISTESGIPDYRSPGGIWSRFRPIDFDEFMTSEEARREYWQRKFDTHETVMQAKPNSGHLSHCRARTAGEGCCCHHPEHRRAAPSIGHSASSGHRTPWKYDVCALPELWNRVRPRADPAGLPERSDLARVCGMRWLREDGNDLLRSGDAARRDAACDRRGQGVRSVPRHRVFAQSLSGRRAPSSGEASWRRPWSSINREQTDLDHLADLVINGEIGPTLEATLSW